MDERRRSELEAAPEKKAGEEKGNRILFFGILAGMIVLNIVIAFVIISVTRPKTPEEKIAIVQADSLKKVVEQTTTMGATTADNPIEAIVNIAGTDGERFLKAAVIFEYDDKAFPTLSEELLRRTPRFKDLLIDHLSKLNLVEVTEPNAKEKIRKDLVRLVNKSLPPRIGEVRDVLFTTFIIQ
ncbi:MAG: flagellar basal body-associated FliL family protein [Fibrobacter sp.]|nr:flagellar basal body-associated FliL family protein [Fibrobacter sp.]